MVRAKTLNEYIDWVKQADYEAEDLRAFIEYDEEFTGDAFVFIDPLEMKSKNYIPRSRMASMNFPKNRCFMKIVEKNDSTLLPFIFLLQRINETHSKGLDT